MNRPKMDSYDLSTKYTMCEFIRDLEKYCDELEKTLKVCKFIINSGTNRNHCSNCPFKNECDYENSKCNKLEEWKEWLMQDE